jgi:hypothetical protein
MLDHLLAYSAFAPGRILHGAQNLEQNIQAGGSDYAGVAV